MKTAWTYVTGYVDTWNGEPAVVLDHILCLDSPKIVRARGSNWRMKGPRHGCDRTTDLEIQADMDLLRGKQASPKFPDLSQMIEVKTSER